MNSKIGSGDSFIYTNVLPADISANIYDKILEEVEFKDLTVKKTPIGRKGAFYVQIGTNGEIPILRCPSIEDAEVKQFTPVLQIIHDNLSTKFNVDLNHVKVQIYSDNTKGVEAHTDKTIDLHPDTPIINYRIGETRKFILTRKSDGDRQVFDMSHNSVFVLGPKTNIEWLHSVEPVNEIIGPSISMVFRQAATFQRSDGHLFGIGAKYKTEQELNEYLKSPQDNKISESKAHKALIMGYVLENKNSYNCRENVYRTIIENTI
jgi:hypothetical protein